MARHVLYDCVRDCIMACEACLTPQVHWSLYFNTVHAPTGGIETVELSHVQFEKYGRGSYR